MVNVSPQQQPGVVDKDTTNNNGMTAQAFRYALGALSQPAPLQTFQWASGIFPGDSNGTTITDYQVTQNTPSANMNVLVQPGQLIVNRTLGGPYIGTSNAAFTAAIGTSNSLPRIDYLVMRVRDLGIDGVGAAVATYAAVVLPGTPSGSPTEPVSSLTDGDLVIAAITVRANTSSILNSDISDRRVFVAAQGGIYPLSGADTRNGAYPGHVRYNLNTKSYEGWDGAAWLVIASPIVWSTFTPVLTYQGASAQGVGSPGTVNLGSGASSLGRYLVIGKTMHLRYVFNGGTSPNAGSGSIYAALPSGYLSAVSGETQIINKLNTKDSSGTLTGIWNGCCYIPPNSNVMKLYFPNSQSDCRMNEWIVARTPGVPSQGIPNISGGYPDCSVLVIQGTIEIQ